MTSGNADSRRLGSADLLQVRGLATHFPVRTGVFGKVRDLCRAVDGVSFDIPEGTTLGLVGESGCGKTTLARTILRLVAAAAGEVWFDGVNVLVASRNRLRQLRRDLQIVFQDPFGSLDPRQTIGETVGEPLDIHRTLPPRNRRARVDELLDLVGLDSSSSVRYPHEFSGGQRQRIGIARALALNPRFIICDEPVSALDVSIQAQILNLLRDLQCHLKLTYLFIAHDLAVVRYVSDRVAVMYLGRLVEMGDTTDLFDDPRHPYTRTLLAAVPQLDPVRRRLRQSQAKTEDAASPIISRSGCAFRAQCSLASEQCRLQTPELYCRKCLAPGHLVACHHADEAETAKVP
ncbi:MAG: ATP-binding cassette domain-containing protein [Planctomycetes bacterium]|nr:ATP-binding cassette domain-containing protein [Planctomycetota bacterium]